MDYLQTPDGVLVTGADSFDIARSCTCGQCFRFDPSDDGWTGIVGRKTVDVRPRGAGQYLFAHTSAADFETLLRPYFDLDRDYDAIIGTFAGDPVIARAAEYGRGIRIFAQDTWETLISFIISQNNNIPRIKGIIERLCCCFGDRLEDNRYSFPTPERLACLDEAALAPLRAGFRTRYILDAARRTAQGQLQLEKLRSEELGRARERLMTVCGVGKKVADCVLLFGAGHLEAFPVDVWIARALDRLYDVPPADFGPYGGLAQQYLFYYARDTKLLD